ncbi:hypothetical protein DFJ77DRAFT_189011 [Powellomyces hirtus]|nr:hypothetical protein DFJ77DRAFT_189011 [Powellomyces hirtus]
MPADSAPHSADSDGAIPPPPGDTVTSSGTFARDGDQQHQQHDKRQSGQSQQSQRNTQQPPMTFAPRDSSLTSGLAGVFRRSAQGSKTSLNRLAGSRDSVGSSQASLNRPQHNPTIDPLMESEFEALLLSNETKKMTSTPDQLKLIDKDQPKMEAKSPTAVSDPAVLGLLGVAKQSAKPDGAAQAAEEGGALDKDGTHWVEFLKQTQPLPARTMSPPLGPRPDPFTLPTPPNSNRSSRDNHPEPQQQQKSTPKPASDNDVAAAARRSPAAVDEINVNVQDEDSVQPRVKVLSPTQALADFLRNTEPPASHPFAKDAAAAKKEKPKRRAAMRLLSSLQSKTTQQIGLLNKSGKFSGLTSTPDLLRSSSSTTASPSSGLTRVGTQKYTMIAIPGETVRRNSDIAGGLQHPQHQVLLVGSKPLPTPPVPTLPRTLSNASTISSVRDSIRKLVVLDPGFKSLETLVETHGTAIESPDAAETGSIATTTATTSAPTSPVLAATTTKSATTGVTTASQSTQTIHPVLVAETEYIFDSEGDVSEDGYHSSSSNTNNHEHYPSSPGEFIDTHACASCGTPHITPAVICTTILDDMITSATHTAEINARDTAIADLQARIAALTQCFDAVADVSVNVVQQLKTKQQQQQLLHHQQQQMQQQQQQQQPRTPATPPADHPPHISEMAVTTAPPRPTPPRIATKTPSPPPTPPTSSKHFAAPSRALMTPASSPRTPTATTPVLVAPPRTVTQSSPPRTSSTSAATTPTTTTTFQRSVPPPPLPARNPAPVAALATGAKATPNSPALDMTPISDDIRLALPEVQELGSLFDGFSDGLLDFSKY